VGGFDSSTAEAAGHPREGVQYVGSDSAEAIAAFADVLEQADYASDTVAELAAALVTKLRG
jgi:hypothetical protein